MSDDNPRHEATTSIDLSRHAATTDDSDYSLSIEDALARYEAAGLPGRRAAFNAIARKATSMRTASRRRSVKNF